MNSEFEILFRRLDAIEQVLNGLFPRYELNKKTKAQHLGTTRAFSSSMCNCCHGVPVLNPDGTKHADAQYEHWYGRSQNAPHQTWLVCAACNRKLEKGDDYRLSHRIDFEAYQAKRERWLRNGQAKLF